MQRDISKFVKKRPQPAGENRDISSSNVSTAQASKGQPGSAAAAGADGVGLLKLLHGSSRHASSSSSSQAGAPRSALFRVLELKAVNRGAASAGSTDTLQVNKARPVAQPLAASVHDRASNSRNDSLTAAGAQLQRADARPGDAKDRYWECYRRNPEALCQQPEQQAQQQQQPPRQQQQRQQLDQPVVVLGGASKRAAMKRAGLDSARMQEIREVRARIETSSRYNHWADGGGLWDSEMIGIDGAEDVGMRWEGVGCTTTGPCLE